MVIAVGDTLPNSILLEMGPEGPVSVNLGDAAGSGKVALFGLPGAFTRTCTAAHLPSFIRSMDKLAEKGVTTVICVAVNDPFCMNAWGQATGATDAGIRMLGDASAEFTKTIGLNFSNPPLGFHDRCKRFSMLVENGVVTLLNIEEVAGACELSAAENLLDQI